MPTSSADSPNNQILIVAAEASSCLYAQRILEEWKKRKFEVQAFGIGNQAMVELGFEALARAEDLAVVGLQEVISHWPVIKAAFQNLEQAARDRRPKAALLLDYPGFNLRIAKKFKKLGIPVVYYISPQLWAWRKGRIKQIKKFVDQMLVVFPFEKPFYDQHHVSVEFVGHPLLDEISKGRWSPEERRIQRQKFGLDENNICLGLMPGSRRSEIQHHLQVQLQAAELVRQNDSRVNPAVLVAPSLEIEYIRGQLPRLEMPLKLIQMEPLEMIQLSDVILCASGTATLMVGLMEVPMVIMYRMNGMTASLAKLLVRSTPFFGMVNLIAGRQIVPEHFQGAANPQNLATEILRIIQQPEIQKEMQKDLSGLHLQLGERGATNRVISALEKFWT